MQYESTPDKKRRMDTVDFTADTVVQDLMFLQIIDEYPYNYLVKIDPELDRVVYEDLLQFEKSKLTIQMNNYEPESLYALYEANAARPDRYVAWMQFFRNISSLKNPEKSKHIVLNRENLREIHRARWFVSFSLR